MAAAEGKKRTLEVIPNADPNDETCATFVLHDEDHTLGNSLRYMIMKNPDVTFCGYTVPHPSENKINLRIQTNGPLASDVLRQGLCELTAVCEHALATFESAVEDFKSINTEDDEEEDEMQS